MVCEKVVDNIYSTRSRRRGRSYSKKIKKNLQRILGILRIAKGVESYKTNFIIWWHTRG